MNGLGNNLRGPYLYDTQISLNGETTRIFNYQSPGIQTIADYMKVTNNSMNMNNNFGYGNEFPNLSEMQWLMFNVFLIINVESLSLDIATGDIHNDG